MPPDLLQQHPMAAGGSSKLCCFNQELAQGYATKPIRGRLVHTATASCLSQQNVPLFRLLGFICRQHPPMIDLLMQVPSECCLD